MISINNLNIIDHWNNPKKLILDIYKPLNTYRYDITCQYDDDSIIKQLFESLQKNEILEELLFNEPDMLNGRTIESTFTWMKHIKFPPNLKKLALPQTYGSFLYWLYDEFDDGVQPTMPPNLETLILHNHECLRCFRFINLKNTNIKNIVVLNTNLHIKKQYNVDIFSAIQTNDAIMSLELIKFYSCNSILLLDEIMTSVKLPYGCIYTATTGKYIE